MKSSYHTTSKWSSFVVGTFFCASCSGTGGRNQDETYDEIVNGTIAYPFVDEVTPIGTTPPEERFIIRSAVGDREYTVEIPGAARDYDVEVPLAGLDNAGEGEGLYMKPRDLANPAATDREMVANLPRVDKLRPTDSAIMDGAFGVGAPDGPKQSPSYTLGIAKINDLYKKREYEYALIEINNMLAFYPTSPRLQKMKGTILLKMNQLTLAEAAWLAALRLTPNDRALRRGIERLQKIIIAREGKASVQDLEEPIRIPEPVGKVEANPMSPMIQ